MNRQSVKQQQSTHCLELLRYWKGLIFCFDKLILLKTCIISTLLSCNIEENLKPYSTVLTKKKAETVINSGLHVQTTDQLLNTYRS